MTHKISDTFKEALFNIGRLIPENVEQIDLFEKIAKKNTVPELPLIFNEPSELLKQGNVLLSKDKNTEIEVEDRIGNGMARAAREGKKENFSEEVLCKMKIDRDNAESKEK